MDASEFEPQSLCLDIGTKFSPLQHIVSSPLLIKFFHTKELGIEHLKFLTTWTNLLLVNKMFFFFGGLRWNGNPLKLNSHTTVRSRVRTRVTTPGLAISAFASWARTSRQIKCSLSNTIKLKNMKAGKCLYHGSHILLTHLIYSTRHR